MVYVAFSPAIYPQYRERHEGASARPQAGVPAKQAALSLW